jgi:uncharacterized membrane protein YbhN (UPF0104 family)
MTTAAPEVADQLPGHDRDSRRKSILGTLGLLLYLYVVFGILLPSIVDYSEVVAAFQAAPPEWLLVVFLIGVFGWVAEGLALRAVMARLTVLRAVKAYLVMAAIGSTLTGAFKFAFGYRLFREWDYSPQYTVLGLTLNGLAAQISKLLLPVLAIWYLTVTGTIPDSGFLVGLLLLIPVALGVLLTVWVMRSEDFARRVGAFATRASGAVLRRMNRPEPSDLTPRLMDFRDSARIHLQARALPTVLSQLLARSVGYFLLVASMLAVGVPWEVLPPDIILAGYAIVMVVTLLPIAPGGAGLPELLYIGLFTAYVNDPSWDDLIAAGVMLMRGMSWFVPIPVGYLVLLWERRVFKRHVADGTIQLEPEPVGAAAPDGDPAPPDEGAPA